MSDFNVWGYLARLGTRVLGPGECTLQAGDEVCAGACDGVDGVDGVAKTVVLHEKIHRVDHRTFLINLTHAHSIDILESTIEIWKWN